LSDIGYKAPVRTLPTPTPVSGSYPDISAAIQDEHDNHFGPEGGRLILPEGDFYMNTQTVTITKPITIQGAGRREYHASLGGTRLIWDCTKDMFQFQGINARTGGVCDVTFDGELATGPTSGQLGWAVNASDLEGAIFIHNVGLHRLGQGIRVHKGGRSDLDQIYGDPLLTGIQFEEFSDKARIGRVHFWPFNDPYSKDDSARPDAGNPIFDRRNARMTGGRGIVLFRVDGCTIEDFFTYGYQIGLVLAGTAPVRDLHIKSMFTDFGQIGIFSEQSSATVWIDNIKHQGEKPLRLKARPDPANPAVTLPEEPVDVHFSWGYPIYLGSGTSSYFTVNHLHAERCPYGWVTMDGGYHRIDVKALSGEKMGQNAATNPGLYGTSWSAFEGYTGPQWAFVTMHANNYDAGVRAQRVVTAG